MKTTRRRMLSGLLVGAAMSVSSAFAGEPMTKAEQHKVAFANGLVQADRMETVFNRVFGDNSSKCYWTNDTVMKGRHVVYCQVRSNAVVPRQGLQFIGELKGSARYLSTVVEHEFLVDGIISEVPVVQIINDAQWGVSVSQRWP